VPSTREPGLSTVPSAQEPDCGLSTVPSDWEPRLWTVPSDWEPGLWTLPSTQEPGLSTVPSTREPGLWGHTVFCPWSCLRPGKKEVQLCAQHPEEPWRAAATVIVTSPTLVQSQPSLEPVARSRPVYKSGKFQPDGDKSSLLHIPLLGRPTLRYGLTGALVSHVIWPSEDFKDRPGAGFKE
jgi:hypothetical protein